MTLKHYSPQEHFLEEPVEVQLEDYPCKHRVTSVCYGRNPYGVRRNKVSYAISEWYRDGIGWRECKELPTAMKLANLIEHPFPKNTDRQTVAKARGEILEAPRPEQYRISGRLEEGDCGYCGVPLMSGDTAFEYRNDIFCSNGCFRRVYS